MCEPSLRLCKLTGNSYTGSLYNGLLSLVANKDIDLKGKNIFMFSYGSGCAASLFTIKCVGDYSKIQANGDFSDIIEKRIKLTPEEYTQIMNERE